MKQQSEPTGETPRFDPHAHFAELPCATEDMIAELTEQDFLDLIQQGANPYGDETPHQLRMRLDRCRRIAFLRSHAPKDAATPAQYVGDGAAVVINRAAQPGSERERVIEALRSAESALESAIKEHPCWAGGFDNGAVCAQPCDRCDPLNDAHEKVWRAILAAQGKGGR